MNFKNEGIEMPSLARSATEMIVITGNEAQAHR